MEEVTSLAARVTNIRIQGKSLVFYDLKGDGKRLQVMCNINNHKGTQSFAEVHSKFRRGDIIGVVGSQEKPKEENFQSPQERLFFFPHVFTCFQKPTLVLRIKNQDIERDI